MTYTITVNSIGDWLWECDVTVGELRGKVRVACETEQEAYDYAEKTYLPDIRKNYPRQLSALVFPWEVQEPEVIE
jgi:hypothetical protein